MQGMCRPLKYMVPVTDEYKSDDKIVYNEEFLKESGFPLKCHCGGQPNVLELAEEVDTKHIIRLTWCWSCAEKYLSEEDIKKLKR